MKKKFALSFVALASVALLAACGEVKSGGSNATGTKVADKTIKIELRLVRHLKLVSTLKKLVQQQLMEQPNKKVPNWLLMKSTKPVVLMARNLKLSTRIINLKQQKLLLSRLTW